MLPYKSDKILGFYQSNVDIDWVDNYNSLKVTLGTGEYTVVPGGYMSSGTAIEKTIDYHYHPLQPLYIKDVNNQQSASSDIQFDSIIPASYLKAIDVKNSLANYLTAGEYVIDVLTTVSGVGNLLKLRHITKLSKLDKAIKLDRQGVAVIEITSGTVNTLLKLTGLADTKYGQLLSEYLFYLEMLALSVDVTDWINQGLKRSATNLLDNQDFIDDLDALKKNAKNADEAKQIDEVIEHLEDVARTKIELNNLSTLGKQGNKVVHILTDEAGNVIGELIRTSKSKRKISFKLKDVEFVNFSSKNSTLNLNSEITLLDTQLAKSPDYGLTVNKGEEILYGDLNIPKDITDELSGLGDLMLQDALLYFKNNKTFNKVDGIYGVWLKNKDYYNAYGGESINFSKFWGAVEEGLPFEEAVFKTFTGKWAKNNGFEKVIFDFEPSRVNGVIVKFQNN